MFLITFVSIGYKRSHIWWNRRRGWQLFITWSHKRRMRGIPTLLGIWGLCAISWYCDILIYDTAKTQQLLLHFTHDPRQVANLSTKHFGLRLISPRSVNSRNRHSPGLLFSFWCRRCNILGLCRRALKNFI